MSSRSIIPACLLIGLFTVSPLAQNDQKQSAPLSLSANTIPTVCMIPVKWHPGEPAPAAIKTKADDNSIKLTDKKLEAEAAEIIEKYISALGAYTSAKTIEIQVRAEFNDVTSETEVTEQFNRRPDGIIRVNRVTDLATNNSINRFWVPGTDGETVTLFKSHNGAFETLSDSRYQQEDEVAALLKYKEGGRAFVRLPNEKLSDGKEMLTLQSIRNSSSGQNGLIKYYFDPTTYLLRRITTLLSDEQLKTLLYDDYRDISGQMIPFVSICIGSPGNRKDQSVTVNRIIGYELNVPFDKSKFKWQ